MRGNNAILQRICVLSRYQIEAPFLEIVLYVLAKASGIKN